MISLALLLYLNRFRWGARSCFLLEGPPLNPLQIPGLGYLYSGLARRKNALSLLFITMVALAITSFQWFFIGYSLVFSETGGTFLGDGLNVGFRGVLERPVPESNGKLPEIVFAMYQMVSRRSPHTYVLAWAVSTARDGNQEQEAISRIFRSHAWRVSSDSSSASHASSPPSSSVPPPNDPACSLP
jgi:hypothetical protein